MAPGRELNPPGEETGAPSAVESKPTFSGSERRFPDPVNRALRVAAWAAPLIVFALVLWALQSLLREYRYVDIAAAVRDLPKRRLVLALAISGFGYLVLVGYDLLGLRFVGRALRFREFALTSFVSSALGNNLGNILITGAAVRYWMYTPLGISAADVAKVVLFCSVGFWLGFVTVSALWFVAAPIALPRGLLFPAATTTPLGFALVALLGCYLALVAARRTPLKLGPWRITLPSTALTLGQIGVASLDISLMGATLYVLLPNAPELTYVRFMGVFLLALLASTASQVPGGLGVFEAAVLLLSPTVPKPELAAALLAFRGIYFILPLFAATSWIALRETHRQLPRLRGFLDRPGQWISAVVPQMVAAAIFVAGAVLLLSGATPAAAGRLVKLYEILPLPVIEMSHFVASLIGAALLLIAHAVQRRVNAAFLMALVLLAAGSGLSLAKGWDYEEAAELGVTFMLLLPFRRYFYREASFFAERFTGAWFAAIAIVLLGSAWIGVFTYSHPEHLGSTWWQFTLQAEATRSLRATVGAMCLVVLFGVATLFRPARPHPKVPSAADLERAQPIIQRSSHTYANLALRRDKALLFSRAGNAFLMYGRMGRSWIAMGDPIGPAHEARELLWQFRDDCDRFDAWSVFFEVRPEHIDWYVDLGLTLTHLGDEARVDLSGFDLDQPVHARLRQARSKLLRTGCRFEIVPSEEVPALMPDLMRVSAAWLARKATREKGFSNASFNEQYLMHFPVAVVREDGEIVAFANLWLGAGKEELSVDLMRHVPEAPNGTMDLLFSELLLWGTSQGYHWFNFGMAPLSGLDTREGSSLWHRFGTFLFRHGEHFYNFRGLRAYKEKFQPVWTPLYLASPGGAALPLVLLDVTALVAGGFSGIFSKPVFNKKHRS